MKFFDQLDGLQEAFRGFRRINKVLEDNWTDSNMATYNATHISPINSSGIKCKQEAEEHMASIDNRLRQLSEDLRVLDYAINHSKDSVESSIEGCVICHCYVHDRIGQSLMKGFLLPKEQANFASDEELLHSIASMKLPEYEDHRDFFPGEMICLRLD